jgi:hypothetical protein
MSGAVRSALFRPVLVMGAGLLLLATFVSAPAFTHGQAATIPFGSAAFAAQWGSIEPVVPNFWGPAVQPALQEPYVEATNGTRLVQYFDKARMEQTTAGGAVTNGLLTVELITGQRQMGDSAFAPFPPSSLPVVGDLTNSWPSYAALNGTVFVARVARSGEPTGTVYKPDGTFALNPGLAAQPGAAYGDYQSDPGGRYAHNIPLAFSAYLAALPLPWQTAMGYPLTEAFWVNVAVNGAPTWVLVQPFERRVLSYTPTNPTAFQVEMGNIGQHYEQWRYATGTTPADTPPASATGSATTATVSGTNTTATRTVTAASGTYAAATRTAAARTIAAASGTPVPLTISSVALGSATESTASLTFSTSIAATTEILYGTSSHAYAFHQDISTTATEDHAVTLTGLQPSTKYYFALRATVSGTSIQRKEDYFATPDGAANPPIAPSPTATKVTVPATATPTATPKPTTVATKTISLTVTQATLTASSPVQLAPSALQLSNATVAVSLTYDGTASGSTSNLRLTTWSHDATGTSASSTDALPPLGLLDKQSTVTITATVTIPGAVAGDPPLTFSFARKMLTNEYEAGIAFVTPPLSSTRAAGYSLTLSFDIAVG